MIRQRFQPPSNYGRGFRGMPSMFHQSRFRGAGHPGHKVPFDQNPSDPNNMQFDGKRMRKAVFRKTIDYNCSVLNYVENRVFQRDQRDRRQLAPDSLYVPNVTPPPDLLDSPMNCVTTRFIRTSLNKIKCPIFCVRWTPEGRRLVTGASSGEFTLWNGLTFNFETILQAHETSVRAMIWSHNDQWMLTADHAGFVKYWQSNMNNVRMYQAHKDPVRGLRCVAALVAGHKDQALLTHVLRMCSRCLSVCTSLELLPPTGSCVKFGVSVCQFINTLLHYSSLKMNILLLITHCRMILCCLCYILGAIKALLDVLVRFVGRSEMYQHVSSCHMPLSSVAIVNKDIAVGKL